MGGAAPWRGLGKLHQASQERCGLSRGVTGGNGETMCEGPGRRRIHTARGAECCGHR